MSDPHGDWVYWPENGATVRSVLRHAQWKPVLRHTSKGWYRHVTMETGDYDHTPDGRKWRALGPGKRIVERWVGPYASFDECARKALEGVVEVSQHNPSPAPKGF